MATSRRVFQVGESGGADTAPTFWKSYSELGLEGKHAHSAYPGAHGISTRTRRDARLIERLKICDGHIQGRKL